MTKRKKTPFRIVGGDGEWWAFRAGHVLPICGPHVRKIAIPTRRGLRWLKAVQGRTPFEALYRLKRNLGAV